MRTYRAAIAAKNIKFKFKPRLTTFLNPIPTQFIVSKASELQETLDQKKRNSLQKIMRLPGHEGI